MTKTKLIYPHATVVVDDVDLAAADGSEVTLDESWSPYAQATVVSPLIPSVEPLSTDPRDNVRGTINAAVKGHWELSGASPYIPDPAVPGSIIPIAEG